VHPPPLVPVEGPPRTAALPAFPHLMRHNAEATIFLLFDDPAVDLTLRNAAMHGSIDQT
jgi:hypothetical protein